MVHAEREGGKAEGTGVDSGQVRSGIPARTASHTQLRRDSEIDLFLFGSSDETRTSISKLPDQTKLHLTQSSTAAAFLVVTSHQ